ncbi:MAG: alkaline phosphatase family protein [Thermoguttaceae bacterium]|jgi:predicted AlkP superfamily phosphohydrolase/phosphomutase
MPRVCIIGWDGATFDLIRPWVAEGKLPTLARLMATGAHGPLRSVIPPMTFPAWSSFLTGKNPGKHGVLDFTRRRKGTYQLEFVNGGQRHAPSFWQILSQAGRKVISISLPCTFPPEPVNGVMISGFDAAGLAGETAYVDARGMYPPGLDEELRREVGRHPIGAFVAQEINSGQTDLALERMLATVRQKAATARYLMTHHPWDCFMVLFGESDGAGHHFWRYCDPNSPLFQGPQKDYILQVYQELDRQTGELLRRVPEDTVVLMVSDHGFGGVSNWVLYPNCWLRQLGLLRFRAGAFRRASRILDGVKLRAMALLPPKAKKLISRLAHRQLGGLEGALRYGMIDWPGTQAYFDENPYYPVLWINLKGREPKGIVEPGREYRELCDRLIRELESWRHPQTGTPIVEKAYRREELYSGPCLEEAPDIIIRWGLLDGYSYAFKSSAKSSRLAWTTATDPRAPQSQLFFAGKSGHHRMDGIFLAHGPGVRAGFSVAGARLIDLAPTVLSLHGMAPPDDMDGRILAEVFTEVSRPAAGATTPSAESPPAADADGYSSEDESTIAERLRSLGYLD